MTFRKPEPTDKMEDHAEQHSHAFDEIYSLKGSIEHNEDRINALETELEAVAEPWIYVILTAPRSCFW